MANHKSAQKAHQKSVERQVRNSGLKSRMRRVIRATRRDIDSGADATELRESVRTANALIDTVAGKGAIHRNAAARHKSRLARRLRNAAQES